MGGTLPTKMKRKHKMAEQTMVYPFNRMLFSNMRKGLPIYPTAWMKTKCTLLSHRSQSRKATYSIFYFGKDKTIDRNMLVAMKEWQSKKGDQKGPQESFRELWCVSILRAVTWCLYLSKLRTIHWPEWTLLYVNYITINVTKGKKRENKFEFQMEESAIPLLQDKYY